MKEELADLAHRQWSGWMDYLFSKCIDYRPGLPQGEEGALVIPKWAVDRWKRQADTAYIDLKPAEMDSDRKEADKFLAVFQTNIDAAEKRIKTLKAERNTLAMLSADEPQFFNPKGIFEAKALRDRILKGLAP